MKTVFSLDVLAVSALTVGAPIFKMRPLILGPTTLPMTIGIMRRCPTRTYFKNWVKFGLESANLTKPKFRQIHVGTFRDNN